MSDYFSQLMARSVAAVGVALPRVSSFYEPRSAERGSLFLEGHHGERSGESLEQSFVRNRPFTHFPVGHQLERVIPEVREADPAGEIRFDPEPVRVEARPLARLTPTDEKAKSSLKRKIAGERAAGPERREESQPMAPGFGEKTEPENSGVSSLSVKPHATATPPKPKKQTIVASKPVASDLQTLRYQDSNDSFQPYARVASSVSADSPFTLTPAIRQRNESEEPGVAQSFESVEPTIHVTIGRVEVRATITDRPARREQPAAPVMSLEEYLRKQKNGAGQ